MSGAERPPGGDGPADGRRERGNGRDGGDEIEVPPGATPHVCEYCGQPFPEAEYLTLHEGLEHYGRLDEDGRAAFDEAYEADERDVRRFRLVALAALILLYFGFLFMYAVFA